eukprot:COSAG02_NODE_5931_length_3935_cov_2.305266_1_plen_358_part_00
MTRRGGRKYRRRRGDSTDLSDAQQPAAPLLPDEQRPAAAAASPPTSPVSSVSSDMERTNDEQPNSKPHRRRSRYSTPASPDVTAEVDEPAKSTLDSIVDSIEAVAVDFGSNVADEDNRAIQIAREKDRAGTPETDRQTAPIEGVETIASELQPQGSEAQLQTPRRRSRRGRKKSRNLADGSNPRAIDSHTEEQALPAGPDPAEEQKTNVGDERHLPASERKKARALRKQMAKQQKRNRIAPGGGNGRKQCGQCAKPECELLVRCESKNWSGWKLVCGKCWASASGGVPDGDAAHPGYRYGGLWRYRKLNDTRSANGASKGKPKSGTGSEEAEAKQPTEDERSTLAGMAVLVALGQEP